MTQITCTLPKTNKKSNRKTKRNNKKGNSNMKITGFQMPKVNQYKGKKNKTINIANDVYTSKVESFTHKRSYDIIVSKDFLKPEDKVLIIDDFLAMGSAMQGLISLIRDAGATIVGAGIIIEKAYQQGGQMIRDMGVRVESLARIKSMDNNTIEFIH